MSTETEIKELLDFYEKKAKEPAGGKFYQVINKRIRTTIWAKNIFELQVWLKVKKIPYDKILQVV